MRSSAVVGRGVGYLSLVSAPLHGGLLVCARPPDPGERERRREAPDRRERRGPRPRQLRRAPGPVVPAPAASTSNFLTRLIKWQFRFSNQMRRLVVRGGREGAARAEGAAALPHHGAAAARRTSTQGRPEDPASLSGARWLARREAREARFSCRSTKCSQASSRTRFLHVPTVLSMHVPTVRSPRRGS